MPKKRKQSGNDIPEWIVTYGDLMSLLLCFFILLAAFSELKQEREYREAYEQISEALGFQGGLGVAQIWERVTNSSIRDQPELAKASDQKMNMDETVELNIPGDKPKVAAVTEEEWVAIGQPVPFELGIVDLTDRNKARLREAAEQIRGQRYLFMIQGNAFGRDDWIAAGESSPEALAFERAEAVRQYLVRECDVEPEILRVVVAGVYEPRVVSQTSVQVNAQNRRVDVYQTGRRADAAHPDRHFTGSEP